MNVRNKFDKKYLLNKNVIYNSKQKSKNLKLYKYLFKTILKQYKNILNKIFFVCLNFRKLLLYTRLVSLLMIN